MIERAAHNILGVDPGIHGGLAIGATYANGGAPILVDAIDINPVAGVRAKERVDVLAIRTWIAQHTPQHALVERAQAMPKQGASSGFKYGRAVGAIGEAVITCCGIPLTIKSSRRCGRNSTGCMAATGKAAASVPCQLFPDGARAPLPGATPWSCAEAALIALAGVRR